jgi:hypothetical protein
MVRPDFFAKLEGHALRESLRRTVAALPTGAFMFSLFRRLMT